MIDSGKIASEHLRSLTPYTLASVADCSEPDTPTSPGAAFLVSIRDQVADLTDELGRIPERGREEDRLHTIADEAPSIYTHERFREFVDLCAYREEPEEGVWPNDLEAAAGVALYQIASRLVSGLIDAALQIVDEQYGDV